MVAGRRLSEGVVMWNYRIFKRVYRGCDKAYITYELHETYYDDAGKPDGWSTEPQAGPAESVEELIDELRMMARDAYKRRNDILDYDATPVELI